MDVLDEVIRDVRPPEVETPGIQIEVPPWAETYDISAADMDGKSSFYTSVCHDCRVELIIDNQQLAEEIVDDKLRRVRHELEPGDVIEAVATVARIDGVDSSRTCIPSHILFSHPSNLHISWSLYPWSHSYLHA